MAKEVPILSGQEIYFSPLYVMTKEVPILLEMIPLLPVITKKGKGRSY